jgi:hypothetical protein
LVIRCHTKYSNNTAGNPRNGNCPASQGPSAKVIDEDDIDENCGDLDGQCDALDSEGLRDSSLLKEVGSKGSKKARPEGYSSSQTVRSSEDGPPLLLTLFNSNGVFMFEHCNDGIVLVVYIIAIYISVEQFKYTLGFLNINVLSLVNTILLSRDGAIMLA